MPTHTEAISMVLDALVNEKTGVLKSLDEVEPSDTEYSMAERKSRNPE